METPLLDVNPEATEVVGEAGFVPALPHGTQELADAVAYSMTGRNAAFMVKHGPIAAGANLAEAVDRALYMEEAAKMTYLIRLSEVC
jgi:ribulose-5-phosphate 4-epimerase/fuculose-1-phosphate aldolase